MSNAEARANPAGSVRNGHNGHFPLTLSHLCSKNDRIVSHDRAPPTPRDHPRSQHLEMILRAVLAPCVRRTVTPR